MENSTEPKNKKQRDPLYITIIIFLIISNGFMFWMYSDATKKIDSKNMEITDLNQDKKTLENDLNNMLEQYDMLESNNDSLNAELSAQKQKIKELLKQAEKHKDDAYIIYKLRKEASTLREIMKGYIRTIDSLNTLNVTLRAEKAEIGQKLESVSNEKSKLEEKNQHLQDKVRVGARLKASNISAIAQRVKSNDVHRETSRAKSTDKIKTCFVIDKNELTPKGEKNIYIRIIAPDSQVLQNEDSGEFEFNGNKGKYSLHREILYENQELDVCFYWTNNGQTLKPGEYIIQLFHDQGEIGKTSLILK